MKGCDREIACRCKIERLPNAGFHLVSRFLGERQCENALAIHPDLTYEHHWRAGELIVWDNRCVMHRATPYDPRTERRVVRRCTILGGVPVRK